ncbi:cell division FtsZ family protein [Mycoplasma sp. ES3157-GEN-MYC]|uniref:Cell division protein FtsZ n=1 Tax=Mycoplasma miroungigenitalium TaxID=754515 RepID=A0A6M4JBR5_9MOLU|nr:cell division protein FtsZ [Mycoplasma miroungigenitalium]MBU4690684.1 cell division FtsZ family protein [Mycoplasma miroungigenitalium]MBU4691953.1 cell division FtsZ family protein [Mycoplasma miroungigenitalium]QJR43805.1 cell division protein FtsZ [Mycoplasma miroungigenitalium]
MDLNTKKITIKVIGIGGAGGNMVNSLVDENLENVELFVANTDNQDLIKNRVENKIQLGNDTAGLGTGGNPEIGAQCANESLEELDKIINNTDLLILVAGLGGGTGTGATPVIADYAKKHGILTLAIVTTPMEELEGSRICAVASHGLREIKDSVNSYMVISNEKLMKQNINLPLTASFQQANICVRDTIELINSIANSTGFINIDFNDIKQVLSKGGKITTTTGKCNGDQQIQKAMDLVSNSNQFVDKPQSFGSIILHFQVGKSTSYGDLLTLKKEILNHYGIDETVDTQMGIDNVMKNDSRDEYFKFSIILTESNDNKVNKLEQDTSIKTDSLDDEINEITSGINLIGDNDINTTFENSNNTDPLPEF